MSCYHPHFADEQVKHRGNSAKETPLVGAWLSRANWHNPCAFLPKVTRVRLPERGGRWPVGDLFLGELLVALQQDGHVVADHAHEEGDDNDGQDHPETDVGVKQQLRPRHLHRVGSRPSVTGFLFVGAPGPSWGRLWAFSPSSARRDPDPTAALSLESCPKPGRRAAHFRRGRFTSWRGRAEVASVWRPTGGKVEEAGRRRLLRRWLEQRSSSLEASWTYGLVSRSQQSLAFPSEPPCPQPQLLQLSSRGIIPPGTFLRR